MGNSKKLCTVGENRNWFKLTSLFHAHGTNTNRLDEKEFFQGSYIFINVFLLRLYLVYRNILNGDVAFTFIRSNIPYSYKEVILIYVIHPLHSSHTVLALGIQLVYEVSDFLVAVLLLFRLKYIVTANVNHPFSLHFHGNIGHTMKKYRLSAIKNVGPYTSRTWPTSYTSYNTRFYDTSARKHYKNPFDKVS